MKKTWRIVGKLMTLGLCVGMMASTQAYEAGDMLLKFGGAVVAPNTSTGHLYADGVEDPLSIGSDLLKVDPDTQLGISFTYMFMPILGLELLAATPFTHNINTDNGLQSALGFQDLGSTRHLPPTLSLQYYPMGHSAWTWQPYLGLGVNYTWFFDEQLSSNAEGALGASDKDFMLEDSWGVAASVGVDWLFGEYWFANASVMWIDINTEATIDNSALGKVVIKDVELDPLVYRLNMGYRF